MNTRPNSESPFKRGDMREIVEPRARRSRWRSADKKSSNESTINSLYRDLVQVFANNGITLSRVYTLAAQLVARGWVKHRKIDTSEEQS